MQVLTVRDAVHRPTGARGRLPRLALALAVLGTGCSCSDASTSSPTATPPPTSTAAPAAAAPAPAPDRDRLLAEARSASTAHDDATAHARYQALLALPGATSSLYCDAGYAAHLAGHDDIAAFDLDVAVSTYSEDLPDREEPSRCFYERGLVFEAAGNPIDARASYRYAITFQPNADAQQHLDALPPAPDSIPPTVAGMPYGAFMGLGASSSADIARALAMGTRNDSFEGHARVQPLASLQLENGTAYAFGVESPHPLEAPDASPETRVSVAIPLDHGFRIIGLTLTMGFELQSSTTSMRVESGQLRVDVAGTARREWVDPERWEEHPTARCAARVHYDETHTAFCALAPSSPYESCRTVTTRLSPGEIGPLRCASSDGEPLSGAPAHTPRAERDFQADISLLPDGRVHVTAVHGDPPYSLWLGGIQYSPGDEVLTDIGWLDTPAFLCVDHSSCASSDSDGNGIAGGESE
jgi:hypothetical protein